MEKIWLVLTGAEYCSVIGYFTTEKEALKVAAYWSKTEYDNYWVEECQMLDGKIGAINKTEYSYQYCFEIAEKSMDRSRCWNLIENGIMLVAESAEREPQVVARETVTGRRFVRVIVWMEKENEWDAARKKAKDAFWKELHKDCLL